MVPVVLLVQLLPPWFVCRCIGYILRDTKCFLAPSVVIPQCQIDVVEKTFRTVNMYTLCEPIPVVSALCEWSLLGCMLYTWLDLITCVVL